MSKRTKIKKTQVEQLLDKNNIPYQSLEINVLNQTSAEIKKTLAQAGINKESLIYKTRASNGDISGPVIAVLPITKHLDEKKLAAVSGNKRTEMIPLKDLQKTTGYVH
uniref:YbaK/EbsC family protein n=1 Tax=Liquorilactobacillus sicerae TaxID=1416943 RepID=UPI0031F3A628